MMFLASTISLYSLVLLGQVKKYDNSIFWEIRKTSSSSPSYILGSIHMMDTSQINFPINTFTHLIDQCENICLEISGLTDSSLVANLAKNMILPSFEKNVTNSLDKNDYNKLTQMVDSSKYILKSCKPILGFIRPSVLSFIIVAEKQLTGSILFKNVNFQPEKYFEQYAKIKRYEITQLETIEQQIDLICMPNLAFDKSIEILKQSIDGFYVTDSIDMLLNYRNQNLALLKSEVYSDSTMILRNIGMAEGIDNLIKERPTFIIIGAAHLPYEHGVLNLLTKKGYIIKPYTINLNKV